LWTQMLVANDVITLWLLSSGPTIVAGSQSSPPVDYARGHIQQWPAYNLTWSWHDSSGCGDQTGWQINSYNIGTGGSPLTDGSLSSDACQYLFQDNNGVT